ncbi:transposable element Tcb1 transposase [Trichonephila clavipes]|nr:transposable element Tcb1 transposase [Trichonephila clavipes]
MLAKNFKKYFLDEDSLVSSYEWTRDLFQDTPEGLSTSEEEIFMDFTSIRIAGTLNSQRNISEVLEPVVLPYIQRLPSAIFQKGNARPHVARNVQEFFSHQIELLP